MPLSAALLATIVALCWGMNYTATRFALDHFPAIYFVVLRYVLVCGLLLPFAFRLPSAFGVTWRQLLTISFLMIAVQFSLVFSGMWLGLDIASTVIAAQLGVPFSCVLGAMFLGDRLGRWRSFGLVVAFSGIVVIAGTPNVLDHTLAFWLVVAGTLSWACANVYMKSLPACPVMPLLFWTGLLALPQLMLVSALLETDHLALLHSAPWQAWAGIAYSATFSTIVAYGLWYWLLARYPVSQVTPYSMLIPITGFGAGVVFFEEHLTWALLVGGVLTVVGVAIITLRRPKLLQRGEPAA